MNIYIATQPIFDSHMNVVAYEILYRNSEENVYSATNADVASSSVVVNTFNTIGIEELTGGRPAFINFTRKLILDEVASIFPNDKLVIEIIEDVEIDEEVIAKVQELKDQGYQICLDNFEVGERYERLIPLANYVKVDFYSHSPEEIKQIIDYIDGRAQILAVKVETMEEFEDAVNQEFDFFQGYFFSKPIMHTSKDIAPFKLNYLQLIKKVNEAEINFDDVSDIISRDTTLSYKLLMLVNSVTFSMRREITNIRQAVVVLGQQGLKKWITLLALKGMSEDKPLELVRLSLIRAKFAEELAKIYAPKNEGEYFLLGLLSAIDAMMDRPMEEVLESINIADDMKLALVKKEGPYADLLKVIFAYEIADEELLTEKIEELNISRDKVFEFYLGSCHWYNEIMESIKA
jgi:EAL and modified HD-GYP domain-containing signal transduction protein